MIDKIKLNEFVINNIDFSEYPVEWQQLEKKEALRKEFEIDYSYQIKTRGLKAAFLEWFCGLPSAITVNWLESEIEKDLIELGYTEKKVEKLKLKSSLLEELGNIFFNEIYNV